MGRGDGHRPWLWLLNGVVAALVGTLMSLTSVPLWTERERYRTAPACEDGPADGCVLDATAVVERTRVRRYKADDYLVWLRLDRPDLVERGEEAAIELPDPDLVFSSLTPGRAVGVRVWDRRVARIDVPGVGGAETENSPLTASLELTIAWVALLSGGAYGVWGGVVMGRRHGWRRAPTGALKEATYTGVAPLLVGLSVGVLVAFVLVVALDVYHPAALLSIPGTALPVAWAMWRQGRRRGR